MSSRKISDKDTGFNSKFDETIAELTPLIISESNETVSMTITVNQTDFICAEQTSTTTTGHHLPAKLIIEHFKRRMVSSEEPEADYYIFNESSAKMDVALNDGNWIFNYRKKSNTLKIFRMVSRLKTFGRTFAVII